MFRTSDDDDCINDREEGGEDDFGDVAEETGLDADR